MARRDPRPSSRLDLVSESTGLTPRTQDGPTPTTTATRRETLRTTARERWDRCAEADRDQREREKEDLKFARGLPEDQWPQDILTARRGGIGADGRAIPARPTLVIHKIDQPLQQIVNEARQARLAIEIKVKGAGATAEGAELRQGMIRAIEVDSNAQDARLWALERAVICGRGYYRVLTEYANDGDFDLDLRIEAIANQGAVYLDPYSVKPDGSDAEYAFLIEDLAPSEYKRRFPTSTLAKRSAGTGAALDLQSVTDMPPDWIGEDGWRVAEYWYIEHEARTLYYGPTIPTRNNRIIVDADGAYTDTDGEEIPATALPPGFTLPDTAEPEVKTREVDVRHVKRSVLNAIEVIDEVDWEGRWIPIIPVVGKRYVVDGSAPCWKGVVSNAKDGQRLFNYGVSSQAEAMGLTTKAPYILDPKQIEGFEAYWQAAATTNLPYLPARQWSDDGARQYAPPQRNMVEPALQGLSIITQLAEASIKATTGRFDPSLGQMSGERSGRAIKELKQQGENSSSNYLENLASLSMTHEARILLDLLKHIYDRRGRIVRLLGDEPEHERQVMLGAPMPMAPGMGQAPQGPPMGMPPQMPPPGMPMSGPPPGMGAPQMPQPAGIPGMPPPQGQPMASPTVYDLSRGEYSVVVTVGKSSLTQRDANATMIQSVIEASGGQAAPFLLDIWAEQVDSPMGKKVAKRLKLANPALAQDESGQPAVPPQFQAQMQQLQQQLQLQGQALQQAQQQIQMDSAKAQAQTQIEQMKAQAGQQQAQADAASKQAEIDSKERIAALNARVELAKVRATIQSKEALAVFEAENARLLAELEVQSEEQASLRGQMHEDRVREVEHTRARESDDRTIASTRDAQIGKAALADLAATRRAAPPSLAAPPDVIDTLTPPAPTVAVGPSGAASDPRM